MAPFACDAVRPTQELLIDANAASNASPQNNTKDDRIICTCTVDRLRQGKAISVVGDSDVPARSSLKVSEQVSVVECGGVSVFH